MVVAESTGGDPKVCGLLVPGRFLHIPGPNPVLLPGPAGAWDDGVIEAADALHDGPVYYFFYHGTGKGKGISAWGRDRVGPAWTVLQQGGRPILDFGPPGSRTIATLPAPWSCGNRPAGTGCGTRDPAAAWVAGGSGASAWPLRRIPWGLGRSTRQIQSSRISATWAGWYVLVGGTGCMLPTQSTPRDRTTNRLTVLAQAESPAGPWVRWPKNPVLREGPPVRWTTKGSPRPRSSTPRQRSTCSTAAHNCTPNGSAPGRASAMLSAATATASKHVQNPVAVREACPNAAAFARSTRSTSRRSSTLSLSHASVHRASHAGGREAVPAVENLGIEALVTARPYRLQIPLIHGASVAPNTTTTLAMRRRFPCGAWRGFR